MNKLEEMKNYIRLLGIISGSIIGAWVGIKFMNCSIAEVCLAIIVSVSITFFLVWIVWDSLYD